MIASPTLYLSNWSSHRTPGMHGPGPKFTIMARPREWEHGGGRVPTLIPAGPTLALMDRALDERRAGGGTAALDEYREAYCATLEVSLVGLRPGRMMVISRDHGKKGGTLPASLWDGDTLCCACSVAEARAGRCHRTWAAPFLVRAGWRVVLDGAEVSRG